jgi:hypothetical protein
LIAKSIVNIGGKFYLDSTPKWVDYPLNRVYIDKIKQKTFLPQEQSKGIKVSMLNQKSRLVYMDKDDH